MRARAFAAQGQVTSNGSPKRVTAPWTLGFAGIETVVDAFIGRSKSRVVRDCSPNAGGGSHPKLNIAARPIAKKYCEGKVKRILKRGSKALEIVETKAQRIVEREAFVSIGVPQGISNRRSDRLSSREGSSRKAPIKALFDPRGSGRLVGSEGRGRNRPETTRGFFATRLETRTKESNMYASLGARNPGTKRKRGEPAKKPRQEERRVPHCRPVGRRSDRARASMMGPERW